MECEINEWMNEWQKRVIIQNKEKQLQQARCSAQTLQNLLPHHINFWSTIITVILFYFISMKNISLTSRSCFQYMFSLSLKRPARLPFAILHLQIIFYTWFAGMVMIYHYSRLHIPQSLVHYLLSTNQKLKKNLHAQVVHILHCTKTCLHKNAYFSKFCYHTSFEDHKVTGMVVTPTSQYLAVHLLLLLNVSN